MTDQTARIRADIEQTRAEMGDTVEALATELSPRTQAERAQERLREVVHGLREDPRPLAAPAAALVLLLLLKRRRR